MSAEILRLEDYRPDPHVVQACGEGHVHVMPVRYLELLVHPEPQEAEPLPECLVRMLIRRWLSELDSSAG